ncbi:MAG: rRNA pseudouridine synthase [Treponema sp.]|nr:rRNA pseudouridine synthase [Treponema sp.]
MTARYSKESQVIEAQGKEPEVLRLQVYLAHSGAASRRAAEKIISQGRVAVNGKTVITMGEKVYPGDKVTLDGEPVKPENRFHYLVLNKPEGYLCSSSDPQGRLLAKDLLPDLSERLYNVGRLDYLSSGLVIFTNDGDFTRRVSHPSHEIEKEYLVESTVPIPDRVVEDFSRGVLVEGVLYKALEAEKTGHKSIRIVMIEGKNREIRRVFSHFHLHAQKLLRIRIGPVRIGDLKEGESRPLTNRELNELLGVNNGNSH